VFGVTVATPLVDGSAAPEDVAQHASSASCAAPGSGEVSLRGYHAFTQGRPPVGVPAAVCGCANGLAASMSNGRCLPPKAELPNDDCVVNSDELVRDLTTR